MITANEQLKQLNSELVGRAHRFVTIQEWEKAKDASKLVPRTKIVPDHQQGLPDWSHRKYIFAIDENDLSKWKENEQLPCAMDDLINHVKYGKSITADVKKKECSKVAELSFNLEEADETYVLDYAHKIAALIHEKNRVTLIKNLTLGFFGITSKQWKTYTDSRVPYTEYNGSYCLPELAISKAIDISRIKLERIID